MDSDQRILKDFIERHPKEVAMLVEAYTDKDTAVFFEYLPLDASVKVLSLMDRQRAAKVLGKVNLATAIKILTKMPFTIAEVLLRQMDGPLRENLLQGVDKDVSLALRRILSYTENQVGSYIDPIVLTLNEDLTVGQGLENIRKDHRNVLPDIFILSRDHRPVGMLGLKELIKNGRNKKINTIMEKDVPRISANMDVSILIEGKGWKEEGPYLAVVDAKGIFLGTIDKKTVSRIDKGKETHGKQALEASSALGELYQIGLSSFIKGTIGINENNDKK